jgi:hypothetical protein
MAEQPPKTGPARALWDLDEDEVREIFDEDEPEVTR